MSTNIASMTQVVATDIATATLASVSDKNKNKALERLDAVQAKRLEEVETALSLNEQIAQSKIVDLELKGEEEMKLYADDREKLERALEEWKEAAEKKSEVVESMEEARGEGIENHPVLGSLIADLGHKKIYKANIEKLASLPVWKKQRIFRVERAEKIVRDKLKQNHKFGLPGIITLCEGADGNLKVLDGQHRVAALSILTKLKREGLKGDGKLVFDPEVVLVEVFQEEEQDVSFAEALFTEINRAEPVKLVDMPDSGASPETHRILRSASENFRVKYKTMFSDSSRCMKPNVNIDTLRDNLFKAEVLSKNNLSNEEELLEWLEEQNTYMERRLKRGLVDAPERAIAKAVKKGFFLGLDDKWLTIRKKRVRVKATEKKLELDKVAA